MRQWSATDAELAGGVTVPCGYNLGEYQNNQQGLHHAVTTVDGRMSMPVSCSKISKSSSSNKTGACRYLAPLPCMPLILLRAMQWSPLIIPRKGNLQCCGSMLRVAVEEFVIRLCAERVPTSHRFQLDVSLGSHIAPPISCMVDKVNGFWWLCYVYSKRTFCE